MRPPPGRRSTSLHLVRLRDANVPQRENRLAELASGGLRHAEQGEASGQQKRWLRESHGMGLLSTAEDEANLRSEHGARGQRRVHDKSKCDGDEETGGAEIEPIDGAHCTTGTYEQPQRIGGY